MSGLIVIGAGPGVGLSVARRFAREGFPVGVVARSRSTVDWALSSLGDLGASAHGLVADATDETGLRDALDQLVARMGVPEVVVYNAAVIQWDAIGDLTASEHLDAWAVNVVGAVTTAAHLLPKMVDAGGGTFVVTGGMPTPVPQVTSLSLGKAGVRALVELLDAQFGPSGIHAATVTIHGAVAPGTAFDPDAIAEEYLRLHRQPPGSWVREVHFRGVDVPAPTPGS